MCHLKKITDVCVVGFDYGFILEVYKVIHTKLALYFSKVKQ